MTKPHRLGAGLGREAGRELEADLGLARQQGTGALDLGIGLARRGMQGVARRIDPRLCLAELELRQLLLTLSGTAL